MKTSPKRPYRLKARAKRWEEVHRRITKAAVEMHGTVGPARTTIGEIARRAGVRRATVYNHFPTDRDLLDACSSDWFRDNPPPDPAAWTAIADPDRRVRAALTALYAYYDSGRQMLANVLRDAPQVTALQEILQAKWRPLQEAMVAVLADAREGDGERDPDPGGRPGLRVTLAVALDFFTWEKLAAAGLSDEDAAEVAAGWVASVRGHVPPV